MSTVQEISFITRTASNSIERITIAIKDITDFGVSCQPCYRKNGTFKKWLKFGFIKTKQARYSCSYHCIAEVKSLMKGQYEVNERHTLSQSKFSSGGYFLGERKATDWIYKVSNS